jgi:tRNA uridine 5-carbamoylmethylation protein Kti12
MNKTLYLVRGLPGSGKTTFATTLVRDLTESSDMWNPTVSDACVVSADDYFMVSGRYEFQGTRLPEAHKHCRDSVIGCMMNGINHIFVANTFTTVKEMEPYYEMANEHGYMVVSMIIENRHGGENVHNVPEHVINRMKNRFDVKL